MNVLQGFSREGANTVSLRPEDQSRREVAVGSSVVVNDTHARSKGNMENYVNEKWRATLAHNGLADFDSLWNLDASWFEEPNRRRGGWSGVSRFEMMCPDGEVVAVFIKRQENHDTRSWRHPLRGIPTFQREFERIMAYRRCGVPTLEPVYFGVRREGRDQRAILVTEEMSGFRSLSDWVHAWTVGAPPSRQERRTVITAVAALLRRMHEHHIRHGCFFPKHVFVRVGSDGRAEARAIDLEKSRFHPIRMVCSLRDLYSLNHYSPSFWTRTDRLRFLLDYLGIARLTSAAKRRWHQVAAVSERKNRDRA